MLFFEVYEMQTVYNAAMNNVQNVVSLTTTPRISAADKITKSTAVHLACQ